MKARTLSPLQAEYTTATDSLCLDLMPVFSAYLWEESIYAWLGIYTIGIEPRNRRPIEARKMLR